MTLRCRIFGHKWAYVSSTWRPTDDTIWRDYICRRCHTSTTTHAKSALRH